jgi:hypothetical protein
VPSDVATPVGLIVAAAPMPDGEPTVGAIVGASPPLLAVGSNVSGVSSEVTLNVMS